MKVIPNKKFVLIIGFIIVVSVSLSLLLTLKQSSIHPPTESTEQTKEDYFNFSVEQCKGLKKDYGEFSGDVGYIRSPQSECLSAVALKSNNYNICEGANYDHEYDCILDIAKKYGDANACAYARDLKIQRPYYVHHTFNENYDDCMLEVYKTIGDPASCNLLTNASNQSKCNAEFVKSELESLNYTEQAVAAIVKVPDDLKSLNDAITICDKYHYPYNITRCYTKVSDKYTDFESRVKLLPTCLNNPTENEWKACIYGHIVRDLSETEPGISKFADIVKSNSYRSKIFCELYSNSSEIIIPYGYRIDQLDMMRPPNNKTMNNIEESLCTSTK